MKGAIEAYQLTVASAVSTPIVKEKPETKEERTQILLIRILEKGTCEVPKVKPDDVIGKLSGERTKKLPAVAAMSSPPTGQTSHTQ